MCVEVEGPFGGDGGADGFGCVAEDGFAHEFDIGFCVAAGAGEGHGGGGGEFGGVGMGGGGEDRIARERSGGGGDDQSG